MKKLISIFIIAISLIGCVNNESVKTNEPFVAQSTITDLVLHFEKTQIEFQKKYPAYLSNFIRIKHEADIFKSIQVVDQFEIPNTDMTLVFYSYSVGIDIVRKTMFTKKVNGKYYIVEKYYSSYDDDPFKNGKGEEGKALLTKADKWTDENNNIDWM